jgi:hypothetical protein
MGIIQNNKSIIRILINPHEICTAEEYEELWLPKIRIQDIRCWPIEFELNSGHASLILSMVVSTTPKFYFMNILKWVKCKVKKLRVVIVTFSFFYNILMICYNVPIISIFDLLINGRYYSLYILKWITNFREVVSLFQSVQF